MTYAIYKSCKIKAGIVEKDEKEKNLRMILNFGHTFAHGFESAKNFSKKLNHGEAVLLGMECAINFAYQKKIINKVDYNKILKHYIKFKLPMNLNYYFSKKNLRKILFFMKKDKNNNNNKINLVLLRKTGKVTYNCKFNDSQVYNFLYKKIN